MARFHGKVGYAIATEDPKDSGIWVDRIVETAYTGDVIRDSNKNSQADTVVDDVSVTNRISVIADNFAIGNFHCIKYVGWMGSNWTVKSVEFNRPRLILSLGGVYNGPTA